MNTKSIIYGAEGGFVSGIFMPGIFIPFIGGRFAVSLDCFGDFGAGLPVDRFFGLVADGLVICCVPSARSIRSIIARCSAGI